MAEHENVYIEPVRRNYFSRDVCNRMNIQSYGLRFCPFDLKRIEQTIIYGFYIGIFCPLLRVLNWY